MKELPPSVRRSARAYAWLVQAYPNSFRREFGLPMVQVFTDMATEARQNNGLWGLVWMWFRVLADLTWSVLSEHAQIQNRRPEMKTAFYTLASVLLAIVVHYFVMMIIGIAILSLVLIFAESFAASPLQGVLQWLMFFLPAFLAPTILMHTKPVYRPWLTAPLGSMAFFTFAFLSDSKAPWWMAIAVIAVGGVLSLAGCYLGSRMAQRQPKEVVALSGAAE